MKPLKLKLCAWGSYAREEIINFEKIEQNGRLFLITGRTGAGKTSIFDAITFALYGAVSGSMREKSSFRSDFADPQTEAFVELEFLHRGHYCKIRRTPKQEHTKKKGIGIKTFSETAFLSIDQKEPKVNLAEVNKAIEELMGINYEQFKQISMIAQGEFMKFLVSDSKKKVEILRSLFQTGYFKKIQEKLLQKSKNLSRKVEEIKNQIAEAIRTIDPGKEEALKELLVAEEFSYEAIIEETLKRNKQEQFIWQEKEEQYRQLEEEVKAQVEEITRAQEQNHKINQLKKCREEFAVLEMKQEEILQKKQRLEAAEAAFHVSKQEQQFINSRQTYERLLEKLKRLEKERGSILPDFEAARKEQERNQERMVEIADIEREEESLQKVSKIIYKIQEKEKELQTIQKQFLNMEDKEQKAKREYERKEHLYQSAIIGLAARYLRPNQPCPVCGSLDHPQIAKIKEGIPDETELKRSKEKYEKLQKEKQAIVQEASQLKGRIESEKKEKEEIVEKLDEKLKRIWQEKNISDQNMYNFLKILKEQKQKKRKEIDTTQKQYEEKKKQKEQNEMLLSDTEMLLKEEEKNLRKEEEKYEQDRLSHGFQTEKEYHKALINEKERKWLREKIQNYNQEFAAKQEVIRNLEKETTQQEEIELKGLQQKLDRLEKEKKELRSNQTLLLQRIKQNEKALLVIQDKLDSKEKWEKEYGIVGELNEVAKGNNRENIVFEHYILTSYFQEILQSANQRLFLMSGGRYELKKIDKVEDGRTKDSLGLEVLDQYTGKKRSVKTLSGGETFYAALSLSLGLSDMVQRYSGGIVIDTLFIDEGFGMLDSETLEQAVSVLYQLSKENHIIGIISHVLDLKEQINNQIEVKKSTNGSYIQQNK